VSVVLSPPEPLRANHQIDSFTSGEPSLDDWLKRRALANQVTDASRTYVVCEGNRVVGYYALASGAIALAAVPGKFRRNMPDPIPVVVLARLAIDRSYQGRGLGRGLFRNAAHRVAQAADTIGIRGIVVHAISDQARDFYLALGFEPCLAEARTLVVTLRDIRAVLEPRTSRGTSINVRRPDA
jgi:ribosomal protein S18 acetylase RimI-like enzyme